MCLVFSLQSPWFFTLCLFLEIRIRFLFGGQHGEFRFLPPPGFTPCSDALLPKIKLTVEACQTHILNHGEGQHDLFGPLIPSTPVVFIPAPVDISKVKIIEIFIET